MTKLTVTDRKYCVYLITNMVNGKQYAGLTSRGVSARWKQHCRDAKKKKKRMASAINKYGADSFAIVVLRENLSKEEAEREEILAIRCLRLTDPSFGYNMTEGGWGGTQIEEVRVRLGRKNNTCSWQGTDEEERVVNQIMEAKGYRPDPLCGGNYRDPRLPTQQICDEYEQGESTIQIGKRYGFSSHAVWKRLTEAGVRIRDINERTALIGRTYGYDAFINSPMTVERRQALSDGSKHKRRDVPDAVVVRLYKEKWSLAQIGKQFNLSSPTVSYRLTKNNVPLRGGRGPKNKRDRRLEDPSERDAYIRELLADVEGRGGTVCGPVSSTQGEVAVIRSIS